jgi:hypothetical protein
MAPQKSQKDMIDLHNTTQKNRDRAKQTQLKTGSELRCFGSVSCSAPTSDTSRVTLATNPLISHE